MPRVSYNGYYVTFPRSRRGFDSRHPHHRIAKALLTGSLLLLKVSSLLFGPDDEYCVEALIFYHRLALQGLIHPI